MEEEKTPFTRSEEPWLVCSYGEEFETQTFYNVSEDHYYNKNISVMGGSKHILACSHGWLVMLDCKMDDHNCFLWNPVTMMTILLPRFEEFHTAAVVLTSPPNIKPDDNNNCVVAFFENRGLKVKFCHSGDDEWTVEELPLQNINDEGVPVGITSLTTCGGKIYGTVGSGPELVIIDIGKDHNTLTLRHQGKQKISSPCFLGQMSRCSLVESCGEMFLTRTMYRKAANKAWNYGKFKIPRVQVFKLDFEELEWREVRTLGDNRAFLLGGVGYNSLSCPSSLSSSTGTATTIPESTGHIKSNCIYFTALDRKNLYIYDIKDGSTTAYFLFREERYKRTTIPLWILPVFT